MFRINHKSRIVTLENVLKRLYSKNTDSNYKSFQFIQQRYQYYQSSFFPAFLGISTLTIVTAGLSYHYNEDVRENLRPYLSKKSKMILDDYLGPNNFDRVKKKFDDMPGFNILPASFKNPFKSIDYFKQMDDESILTELKSTAKTSTPSDETGKDSAQREADRIKKLNEDLTEKLTKQIEQVEAHSTNSILQLMEYSNKIEQHSENLKRAIEDDGTTLPNPWEDVTASMNLQQSTKLKSDAEIKRLDFSIDKLQTIINDALKINELKSHELLKTGLQTISDVRYRLQQKQADIEKAQFNAQITNQYKELIQQGRERFKQEMASLSPNVSNWTKKRTEKLTNEDLNAIIVHAHRRMHQLQARIAELEAMEVVKLEAALVQQTKKDEVLANDKVQRELERERQKLFLEKQSEIEALNQKHELDIKWALTRQSTAHSEHVNQLLRIQKDEVEKQHDLSIREALIHERDRMRAAIEGWRMRVEGLEAAVEGRADMELLSREAQDLWVACHSLHGVLTGNGVTPPLARYLSTFQEAAQPSSLPVLQLFLDSVPACACEQGVCTLQYLTKRFEKVKTVCKRVAMIDETGASLAMYIVSCLRSMLMLTPSSIIVCDTEIDPENDVIDTHQIIASAEAALCHQDIDLAVRLLNLLKGMPRAIANDWIVDARVYLETKLAADALSSYTSSKTAGSIPPVQSVPLET